MDKQTSKSTSKTTSEQDDNIHRVMAKETVRHGCNRAAGFQRVVAQYDGWGGRSNE